MPLNSYAKYENYVRLRATVSSADIAKYQATCSVFCKFLQVLRLLQPYYVYSQVAAPELSLSVVCRTIYMCVGSVRYVLLNYVVLPVPNRSPVEGFLKSIIASFTSPCSQRSSIENGVGGGLAHLETAWAKQM
jgi:hypothetical protein